MCMEMSRLTPEQLKRLATGEPVEIVAAKVGYRIVVTSKLPLQWHYEPDFFQLARVLLDRFDAARPSQVESNIADVAEQLRQVWNARGAADLEVIERLDTGLRELATRCRTDPFTHQILMADELRGAAGDGSERALAQVNKWFADQLDWLRCIAPPKAVEKLDR